MTKIFKLSDEEKTHCYANYHISQLHCADYSLYKRSFQSDYSKQTWSCFEEEGSAHLLFKSHNVWGRQKVGSRPET